LSLKRQRVCNEPCTRYWRLRHWVFQREE
jgi:hypothetical protein